MQPRSRAVYALAALLVLFAGTMPTRDAGAAPSPKPVETARPEQRARWSAKRLYHVRYESTPSPVPLLAVHTLTITISDAAEDPVRGANVTVLGGMPAHSHGLPTVPVVTEIADGRYRIEGLKFHMPGRWVVAFRIRATAGIDAVDFALDLP